MITGNTKKPETTTIVFIGDVMLGRLVSEQIPHQPPESLWGNTLPIFQNADAAFANLECAITTHLTPWSRTPKVFHFGAVPEAIDVLKAQGAQHIVVVCIVTCPEGIKRVEEAHPDVYIYAASIDQGLNEKKYIVPGLGDAGDRLFGTS